MTPEHWRRVKETFHSALALAPRERAAFLAEACRGDESLRGEIESLIRSHEETGSFIDSPAYEAAQMLADDQIELSAGETIAQYEVVSHLGSGGMGEVYLAEDRRLGRKVALKILPASFAGSADRLRRFAQEARAASALNHPNILTIYETGQSGERPYIATEYVEGETLRQRLARGRLRPIDALDLFVQLASALAAAHQAGIVHRDIKPENIMIRGDGLVKVLDFGIAKLVKQTSGSEDATRRLVETDAGLVVGTARYMSPEQARGLPVDARTDIWSLGVVLYESLTGHAPFVGQTSSDVIAAVLEREPIPLARRAEDVPEALEWIVTKTLTKEREDRYQTARELLTDLRRLKQRMDAAAEIERASSPPDANAGEAAAMSGARAPSAPTVELKTRTEDVTAAQTTSSAGHLSSRLEGNRRGALLTLTALVVAAAAFGLYQFNAQRRAAAGLQTKPAANETGGVQNTVQITSWSGLDIYPSLSPDGNAIAYSSDHNGPFEIYIKQLAPGGREIQLTSDGKQNFEPAWSPDGKLIAYYSTLRGGIWLVPAFGGSARQLTDFGSRPAWSPDGSVIAFQSGGLNDFGPTAAAAMPPSTIWTIAVEGGTPKKLTQAGNPDGGHGSPSWSPDGRRIVFAASIGNQGKIWSISTRGDELQQVSKWGGFDPVYSPDGESIYFTSDDQASVGWALWRLRVSPQTGEPLGEAVIIKNTGATTYKHLRISADGKKIACTALQLVNNLSAIPIVPGSGEAKGSPVVLTQGTNYRKLLPVFSPDGRRIAFVLFRVGATSEIWVMDADGKNPSQLTTEPALENNYESWFPEGDRIAYYSIREGRQMMRAVNLQTGRDQLLFESDRYMGWPKLSPDGKQFAFNSTKSGTINLWTIPVEGGEPKQLTFDQELMGFPSWSPDGRFIALEMKRGEDSHIAIIPSGGGEPVQLTSDRGQSFVGSWSPDGKLFVFAGERAGVWNLWWVSVKDRTEKRLTSYTKLNAYVRYPSWSPLGDRIVYEYAETTGNIWIMDLK
jgi:Tol biopolymer transport system component/serine/threonine protein kinase